MNKKFVYQVGKNKKVILLCMANQISRPIHLFSPHSLFWADGRANVDRHITMGSSDSVPPIGEERLTIDMTDLI